jgi:antitoxin ParD1/3/4
LSGHAKLLNQTARDQGVLALAQTPWLASPTLIIIIKNDVSEELQMISADLGARLEDFISKLVESVRYGSKSEVLLEGVRLIEEREKRLALFDAALERGLADIDAGRTHALEVVADELARRYGAGARRESHGSCR